MQKIVLFVEPVLFDESAFMTPEKIGNIFMNRFSIDEDASTEILGIFELGMTSLNITCSFDGEITMIKGMDDLIARKIVNYLLDKLDNLRLIHMRK